MVTENHLNAIQEVSVSNTETPPIKIPDYFLGSNHSIDLMGNKTLVTDSPETIFR